MHHTLYPKIPPQGIYFESLVETAFDKVQKPFDIVAGTARKTSGHDLVVAGKQLSIKTETGDGTKEDKISITKLCTTEKDPWNAQALTESVLAHLGRYDVILMLRAVWKNPPGKKRKKKKPDKKPYIHYQLLEIPVADLKLIGTGNFLPVGKRRGRKSLGADIVLNGQIIFHCRALDLSLSFQGYR